VDDAQTLATWADRLKMLPLPAAPSTVHAWGDMEVAYAVRREDAGFSVAKQNRGVWTTLGRFPGRSEADAFLLVCLGAIWRADQGLGDIFPPDPAPETTITQVDGGYDVEARGHRAFLRQRPDAKRYTHVAGRSLREVADFLMA